MTLQNRNRLVGGVFFLALAVIFVPMLFDESRGPEIEISPMEPFEIVDIPPIPTPDTSQVAAKREELRAIVDEDGFLVSSDTRVGEPSFVSASDNVDAWVVQLGSFRERHLADALRARLKKDGHSTWTSHAKIQGQVMIRVAVGPYVDYEETVSLRNEYQEKYDVDAVVKGFVP